MRRVIILLAILIIPAINIFAQDIAKEGEPVKSIFWGGRLVDQQTTNTVEEDRFVVSVLHRFGTVENGFEDIFGVYAPSNISMGIGYGITDRLDINYQVEKNNKIHELGMKYRILQQSISDSKLISLSYYLNLSVDSHNRELFGDGYKLTDRFIYTNQLIASRQFNYKWIVMFSLNYIHINSVDESVAHDKMELNSSFGYKLSLKNSLFVSYQLPWDVSFIDENSEATKLPKQGINFGFESVTRTHRFQLFMTTRDNINIGKELIYNNNSIELKNFRLGFNINITIGGKKDKK